MHLLQLIMYTITFNWLLNNNNTIIFENNDLLYFLEKLHLIEDNIWINLDIFQLWGYKNLCFCFIIEVGIFS